MTDPDPRDVAPEPKPNSALDSEHDRAGAGGATDDGAGSPGGTLGTGGAREQDQ